MKPTGSIRDRLDRLAAAARARRAAKRGAREAATGLPLRAQAGSRPARLSAKGDVIGDPTLAGAILDRLVHNLTKLALNGDSMRK